MHQRSQAMFERILVGGAALLLVLAASGCNKSEPGERPAAEPSSAPAKRDGLLQPGDPAPNFTTKAHSGQPVSLEKLRGKVVVLYFYPKDNTPGCTTEAQGFRDAYSSYEAKDAVVIGVSTQDNESHREFAKEHGLPFLLIPDEEGTIADSYGVGSFLGLSKRVTFLIDKDGRVAKVYDDVDPDVHAKEVLSDVETLRGN